MSLSYGDLPGSFNQRLRKALRRRFLLVLARFTAGMRADIDGEVGPTDVMMGWNDIAPFGSREVDPQTCQGVSTLMWMTRLNLDPPHSYAARTSQQ